MTAIAVHAWLWWWRLKSRLLLMWFAGRLVVSVATTFGPGFVFAWMLGEDAVSRWADVRSAQAEKLHADFQRACERHLHVSAQFLDGLTEEER
jgi:hypothetical protein